MSDRYTLEATPAFEAHVDRDLQQIVQAITQLPDAAVYGAIILLGGYGRGEGTPLHSPNQGKAVPYNDYDLVVVSKHSLWPWQRRTHQKQLHALGETLTDRLGIAVDLYLHTPQSLASSERSLLNTEMQCGHRALWGNPNSLAQMPPMPIKAPLLSEGTRLLVNRGRLLLQVEDTLAGQASLDEAQCRKYLYKNWLAFGDCILIAHGDYDLYYQHKRERIEHYRSRSNIPHLKAIIEGYQQACQFKLYGQQADLPPGNLKDAYAAVREIYEPFLLWYEGQRLQTPLHSLDDYCTALTQQPVINFAMRLKNVVLNMLLLKTRLFQPNASWIWQHPRFRLAPALCVLLNPHEGDRALAANLLGLKSDATFAELNERFQSLSARLA